MNNINKAFKKSFGKNQKNKYRMSMRKSTKTNLINNKKIKNQKSFFILIGFIAVLFLSVFMNINAAGATAIPASSPAPTSTGPSIQSCSLFGGTSTGNYNNWMWINLYVLIVSLLVISFIYMASRFISAREREKFTQITKIELIQVIISAAILMLLLTFTTSACKITSSIGSSLSTGTYPVPASNPFQFADYYIGNLSNSVGIKLLIQIYTYAIGFNIDSMIFSNIGQLLFNVIASASSVLTSALSSSISAATSLGPFSLSVQFSTGYDLGASYNILSDLLLSIFAPLVIMAIGLLYLLWLILPVIQFVAFTVVLPVALVLRMIAYSGFGGGGAAAQSVGLKSAANAFLALAIAFYLILPLTIVFNAWAIHWIFSSKNPSYTYLHSTYLLNKIPSSSLFAGNPTASATILGIGLPSIDQILSTAVTGNVIWSIIDPNIVIQDLLNLVNEIAQFEFTVFFMLGIDFAIVIGFAMGLTKALNTNLI
ncbi:MAG: hypothetical protein M1168_01130 [Candidatus Marsarchaeota archaeon]|nr:hypothetical protein [Candidatus Marsarchaeota archaeon]MCL5094569.1 hypothetical protein [Candidatus Marsarchaeota archaeon]